MLTHASALSLSASMQRPLRMMLAVIGMGVAAWSAIQAAPIFADGGTNTSLVITDGQATARRGDTLTYTITAHNLGTTDLTGLTLVDHVPPYLVPFATNPSANSDAAARTITWPNVSIPASGDATFGVRVHVADTAPQGFAIQNMASLSGNGVNVSATDTTEVSGGAAASAAPGETGAAATPITARTGAETNLPFLLLSVAGTAATAGTLLIRRV